MAAAAATLFKDLSREINIETVDHQLLTPEDVDEVVKVLTQVESCWKMIGKYLHISSKVLVKIEKNPRHLHDSANHMAEMVNQWLSLNYNYEKFGMPCWKLLVMAVAKGSGDNTYAIEIAKKYRYPWRKTLAAQMSQTDEITTVSPVDEDDKGVILNSISRHDVGRRWPHVARKLSLKMNVVHDIHERSSSTTECYDQVVSAWLDGNIKESARSQASWEEFLNVMAAPDGGNNVALAIQLAKEKNLSWRPYCCQDNSSEDTNIDEFFQGYVESVGGRSPIKVSQDVSSSIERLPEQECQPSVARQVPPDLLLAPYPILWDERCPNLKRGCAIIFSIKYYQNPQLNRAGADLDLALFQDTFSHLGYEVLVYKNNQCTASGITTVLRDIVRQFGSHHDSFVCCVSAHGNYDSITQEEFIVPYDYNTTTENPKVLIRDLRNQLAGTTCPALATKPKMFFIQACRGNNIPPAVIAPIQSDSIAVHEDSDFFFSYSTRMNDSSCRDTVKGSWYCQELAHVLKSDTSRYYDVSTLVSEVHRRVTDNYAYHSFRQCPELTHTLRKRFFFYKQPM